VVERCIRPEAFMKAFAHGRDKGGIGMRSQKSLEDINFK
jgi:hypothetical protein